MQKNLTLKKNGGVKSPSKEKHLTQRQWHQGSELGPEVDTQPKRCTRYATATSQELHQTSCHSSRAVLGILPLAKQPRTRNHSRPAVCKGKGLEVTMGISMVRKKGVSEPHF